MLTTFDDWLAEMALDGLDLPGSPGKGGGNNTWTLSFSKEALPTLADLVRFIEGAVDVRRSQVERLGLKPVTFYLWHDAQAGQLRFSVACCRPDSLPFGCVVTPAGTAEEIIRGYLDSGRVDGSLLWSELQAGDFDEPEPQDVQAFQLSVWALQLA